jgi:hypothetical protein
MRFDRPWRSGADDFVNRRVVRWISMCAAALTTSGCVHPAVPAHSELAPAPVTFPDSSPRPKGRRFYDSRRDGTESQFNPLSLVVNGGFDQLRTSSEVGRQFLRRGYAQSLTGIAHSLARPDRVIRQYGFSRWLRNEVFPLSLKGDGGGQWYPNYHLHLFAGGMTYVRISEWWAQHGAEHPNIDGAITVYTWHLLTETIEHGGTGYDEDGMTDLLLFDSGSILLWSSDWMQRLFSSRGVQMTDWPGQPSYGLPGQTIENAFMTAMLRVPLPRTDDWRGITTMGASFLVGVSRRTGGSYWLSAMGGFDPADNPVIDPVTGQKTVKLLPNAGVFLDHDGSLLVSVISKGGSTDGASLNVYPGFLRVAGIAPGLWVQQVRGGGVRIGLASRWGLGISRNPHFP